ncbi:hypothetical protein [Rhodococcus sp. ACS1]|uniref:hypothetical protein n=1 Tax=Rhodococcus sp. ACS1 TaxID=2028570 RepID=UPI001C531AD7|nr:hypothetical protein [Rhodococcus sp. ACS1]
MSALVFLAVMTRGFTEVAASYSRPLRITTYAGIATQLPMAAGLIIVALFVALWVLVFMAIVGFIGGLISSALD